VEAESTDAVLGKALEGDPASRGLLLERLRPRLVLWASARLSPDLRARTDPEDLAQDILLAVHRDLASFRGGPGAPFGAWLFRIAENRIRDAADYHGAAKGRAGPLPWEPPTSPSAAALRSEAVARLRDAVGRLPEDYRRVVQLRRLEERPDAEVAALLNRTENAVRILYCRALKSLRAELRGTEP